MKRGPLPNMPQPTIRILLVGQHTYQISFRNIYGYLKTVLLDRCKKIGAQYLYYEKSYVISSEKLAGLKKEFSDLLNMKTSDNKIKFRIEDFPMGNIKMILKPDKKTYVKEKTKNRIIFIDNSSLNRYFYIKKRIDQFYCDQKKNSDRKEIRTSLIVTSDINKKFWFTHILQPKKPTPYQNNPITLPQFPQTIELTYSQLSSKRIISAREINHQSSGELNKIYLITYDNLKFVQNSWILAEIQSVSMLIVDDAEFLVANQCELSTLENKKRNYEAFRLLVKNYPIDQELILFFSKLPEPTDLYKILVLTKPKNFTGIKFSTTLHSSIFNESLFTPEEKSVYDEFSSWFRKRYRNQNKCFKEIYYLLKNIVVKILDESVFKMTQNLIPSLELSPKLQQNFKITLLESSSEIVEKFRVMDRKYKKSCPSINLKQILEDFHDIQKSSERKFQLTCKIDDHLLNKNQKNYFIEAKQLMINSKLEMILKRLFFVINSQKQRICIILEDQKLQKRVKRYLKQTQVEYVDYELPKVNKQILDFQNDYDVSQQRKVSYSQFDSNYSIKACILNIARLYRQYNQLNKSSKVCIKRDNHHQTYLDSNYNYSSLNSTQRTLLIPVLTTPQSVHFIDTFWSEFMTQKQQLVNRIFDFELCYIEETHNNGRISFEQVYRENRIRQVYYLFDGSHEKMMLEKYLVRRQSIRETKIQSHQKITPQTLDEFITNMLHEQATRFSKCPLIDYLDIDDEFDKIQEQAKRVKNNKHDDPMQQKVFLPKFTKPDCKSFQEMLSQRLLQKNIDQILQGEEEFEIKQQNGVGVNYTNDEQQLKSKQGQQLQNIVPQQFLIQTVRLQPIPSTPIITPNNQPKDLFDQLLGNEAFQFNYFNPQLHKKQPQPPLEQVETESQLDEDRYLINTNNKQYQQSQAKDQLLLNFGYLAYHNIQQPAIIKSEFLPNLSQKKQLLSILKQNNDDNSIEIIQTTISGKKQRKHSHRFKNTLSATVNRNRPSQFLSQKIKFNHNNQKLPFYQLPKQKRLCNKKLYEQAISKSKQLWEKKLRKEKQLLIIKTANLQIHLKPKQNWKQTLTAEEKQQLKTKDINI